MTRRSDAETIEILLIEDNPGDVRLTREALKEFKVGNRVNVADDGEKALAYLRREGAYAAAVRPDLILLDLNLPRIGGQEVLSIVKNDPKLGSIPIVVLTTSKAQEDIVKSYESHANCYISKPVELDAYMKMIRSIEDFWFSVVRLPKE
jgi:two-component system, chemotaxis family, response regulator Rcp1